MKSLTTVGRTALASFPDEGIVDVPVKIDTGADASSIWASELHVDDDGILSFALFAKGSKYYSGRKHCADEFEVRVIRSSNGTTQLRYQVPLSIKIDGRQIRATFSLADRSRNTYPVLVGCRLLQGKFLVDVSRSAGKLTRPKSSRVHTYTEEMKRNPREFFEKYHLNNPSGDIEL